MPLESDRTVTAQKGVYIKGPAYRAATWAVDHGYAVKRRHGIWVGGYFVKTDAGAVLVALADEYARPRRMADARGSRCGPRGRAKT